MEMNFFQSLRGKIEEIKLKQAYCYPAKGCYKATLAFFGSLQPLYPYLRSITKTIYFDPQREIIFYFQDPARGKKYKVSLKEGEISWAIVSDREEAKESFKHILDFLENTWVRQKEITPSYKPVTKPPVLEIYKNLPRTNCKKCGFESCYAFSIALTIAEAEPSLCPYLDEKVKILLEERL